MGGRVLAWSAVHQRSVHCWEREGACALLERVHESPLPISLFTLLKRPRSLPSIAIAAQLDAARLHCEAPKAKARFAARSLQQRV